MKYIINSHIYGHPTMWEYSGYVVVVTFMDRQAGNISFLVCLEEAAIFKNCLIIFSPEIANGLELM